MRSPSLYSQDDPITAAMKPPPTETESERRIRLQLEDEAKRVSEQIDEDLREERERLKKKKGDVKVSIFVLFYPFITKLTSTPSCYSWVKPRVENQHCRNSSN